MAERRPVMRELLHEALPDLRVTQEGQEFFEAFRDEHDEPNDPHERRAACAHTPASARGKRASALPRRVLVPVVLSRRVGRPSGDARFGA